MKDLLMTPVSALRRSAGAALLGAAVLAASGCAMLAPKTPEQQVSARADDFWKARRAGDFEKAYAFSTPAYKKLKSTQDYKLQFGAGASVGSSEVNKVVCEPQRCDVQMKLSVTPALVGIKMKAIDTYLNEVWLLEDGQWWHFQDL